MSFIIALHIGDGLVMASDSRITYDTTTINPDGSKNVEHGVHFSNSTPKTFLTSSNVGISYCGNSSIMNKPITGFIESFIAEHEGDDVDAIKDSIIPYFTRLDNIHNTTFIVGGYKKEAGAVMQKLYRLNTNPVNVEEIDTSTQGAIWSGEIDVMSRILKQVFIKTNSGDYTEMINYPILWHYFTLQDSVDFARYAVNTTIDTMQFQRRVKTVGGAVDILVIKPTEAIWIEKRQLR